MSTPNNTSFSLSRLSYFLTFYLYKIPKKFYFYRDFLYFLTQCNAMAFCLKAKMHIDIHTQQEKGTVLQTLLNYDKSKIIDNSLYIYSKPVLLV